MYFSSWALQHAVHLSIIAVKIVSLEFSSSSNISVQTRGSLEQKQKYQSGRYKMQNEDQVQNLDCRLRSLYCFQPFFQFSLRKTHKFSYHTTAQKLEGIYSISLESSHKLNSTVAIFNVQEIDTNLDHNMNEPFDRLIFSPAIHQTGEHSPKNIKPERS